MTTNNENLVLQSLYNVIFLQSLDGNNFLKSCYYNNQLKIDSAIKQAYSEVGLDNQGLLLTFLYSLVVIPRELFDNELKNEMIACKNKIKELIIKDKTKSNYKRDGHGNDIDLFYHIRNSIAHAKVEFFNDEVKFFDSNTRYRNKQKINEDCEIVMLKSNLEIFINELIEILKVFNNRISLRETNKKKNT